MDGQEGKQGAFTLDVDAGRWDVENPPTNDPQVRDAINAVDKMLQAVSEGWNIRAFQPRQDFPVVSWDRVSHGNHPAAVMQRHPETIVFYYEAPDEFGTDDRRYEC